MPGNFQQQVFDAIGPHPQSKTIDELCRVVPLLKASIHDAIKALRRRGFVETCRRGVYQRVAGRARPPDLRGSTANRRGKLKRAA